MNEPRDHPVAKPDGFVPAVQRYSATFEPDVQRFEVLMVGVQATASSSDTSAPGTESAGQRFLSEITELFNLADGPTHHDFAHFTDERGSSNLFATAYWPDRPSYRRWAESDQVRSWWADPEKRTGEQGYFWEPLPAAVELTETIAFKEYVRGLSACPMSTVKPMGESGYWGAARDRMPRSAIDDLVAPDLTLEPATFETPSIGGHLQVQPPERYVLIRSGQSWTECGPEQLTSYNENVLPRLDEGMEFLRTNQVETGCWSLRQVDVVSADGGSTMETYVAGHFISLAHLESWAHHHPTHLAIYGQAQRERIKYQENLELRTYHEVYVVEEPEPFEYINCHDSTGALGLLPAVTVDVAN